MIKATVHGAQQSDTTTPSTDAVYSHQAARIIESSAGLAARKVSDIDGTGMANVVKVVDTDDGRFVVRMRPIDQLFRYEREAWSIEQAHARGIPVPRVLETGCTDVVAYSVARYLENTTTIPEKYDLRTVWTELGRLAAKLNSIPTRGYGSEMSTIGTFNHSSWRDVVTETVDIVFRDDYWREETSLRDSDCEELRRRFLESAVRHDGDPRLCQWDMGLGNARVASDDPAKLTLVDFEFVVSAPPIDQLVSIAQPLGLDSSEFDYFRLGYGIADDELSALRPDLMASATLRSMRSVRWAQDRRPNETGAWQHKALLRIRELLAITT